jgi:hypothetical protein
MAGVFSFASTQLVWFSALVEALAEGIADAHDARFKATPIVRIPKNIFVCIVFLYWRLWMMGLRAKSKDEKLP